MLRCLLPLNRGVRWTRVFLIVNLGEKGDLCCCPFNTCPLNMGSAQYRFDWICFSHILSAFSKSRHLELFSVSLKSSRYRGSTVIHALFSHNVFIFTNRKETQRSLQNKEIWQQNDNSVAVMREKTTTHAHVHAYTNVPTAPLNKLAWGFQVERPISSSASTACQIILLAAGSEERNNSQLNYIIQVMVTIFEHYHSAWWILVNRICRFFGIQEKVRS